MWEVRDAFSPTQHTLNHISWLICATHSISLFLSQYPPLSLSLPSRITVLFMMDFYLNYLLARLTLMLSFIFERRRKNLVSFAHRSVRSFGIGGVLDVQIWQDKCVLISIHDDDDQQKRVIQTNFRQSAEKSKVHFSVASGSDGGCDGNSDDDHRMTAMTMTKRSKEKKSKKN